MRELSEIIREKVVRLFPAGHSYDDISQQLDIAKGSVTNVIDEFRDGQISIPDDMADYVNELRRIAVELKKHQVSLNQLRAYQKLHSKLQDMGANNENVEQWLDCLQVVAASDPSRNWYIDIVGWIADVSKETSKSCKEIMDEYEEKLGFWDYINDEIDGKKEELEELKGKYTTESGRINKQIATLKQMLNQTEEVYGKKQKEMETRFQDFLTKNAISWNKIETVMAAMEVGLFREGFSPKERNRLYEGLRRAGSLMKAISRLEEEAAHLRSEVENMKLRRNDEEKWNKIITPLSIRRVIDKA